MLHLVSKAKTSKQVRGFGAMDPARQRALASKGGKSAHAQGAAHQYTPEEAAKYGKLGGETVSQDRDHMAEIGRKGGLARGRRIKAEKSSAIVLADDD